MIKRHISIFLIIIVLLLNLAIKVNAATFGAHGIFMVGKGGYDDWSSNTTKDYYAPKLSADSKDPLDYTLTQVIEVEDSLGNTAKHNVSPDDHYGLRITI